MYLQGSHHCGGSGQMLQTAIDNRIKRASHETSDDSLYLLDLVMVGAVTHFFFFKFPIPEMVTGIQREVSKMICMISETTNITVNVPHKLSKGWGN